MTVPEFRAITSENGEGITYTCGCPCVPTAAPAPDGAPGFEHCCCGKVHFVGTGAAAALATYLDRRRQTRKREPSYEVGETTTELAGRLVEVAWAFPAS
jgi:hypothetical protein